MYIGIDLGTSGVKVVLTDEQGAVLRTTHASLDVSMPRALWSEQDPADWWEATCQCLDALKASQDLSTVKAIGLSGQMHGATLLDENGDVLRPAILWNDGRCDDECHEIEAAVSDARQRSGNIVMAGFTAPKILWIKHHEPDVYRRIHKVLLPKDYLRYKLTGEFASEMSDAAGTIWLNTESRKWDSTLLAATGLNESHMPALFEGNAVTGELTASLAERWGMKSVPVAGGGGDNAAGAIGCGIVDPGQAMLSLGTSGVYFAVTDTFRINTEQAVHSFCHALPSRWHMMSVMLSAASCLQWYAGQSGYEDVGAMLDDVEQSVSYSDEATPLFLPYLTGERTPHNNPYAKAAFFGVTASTTRAHLARAVIEGVSMALADGMDAVHQSGVSVSSISLIGGGAKSPFWRQLLSDISGQTLTYRKGGDVGPALGAARLAQLAVNPDKSLSDICFQPEAEAEYQPDPKVNEAYLAKRQQFRELYYAIEPFWSSPKKQKTFTN